jgi:hypothetical protein
MMAVDVVDENIHITCHYGFEFLKKMSYYSIKDKAYEGNLEDPSSKRLLERHQNLTCAADSRWRYIQTSLT